MTLYLKYRPKDFDTLVWQDYIKNTLKNACKNDKLVWAYLFCWPRWTGKTSTARIFAKAINCLNPHEGNPCLNCEICKDFASNNLLDIIEIDAASYTWVDNIRAIIEKAVFMPTKAKYKVYIIDEVHMLSKWAFNALLKILEEPPEYLKFILATTETHKVPETILSRCQKYDFKSIKDDDMKNRLSYIAKEENVNIDDLSMDFIVKNSAWWLRNAISTFEQLINFQNKIIWEEVSKNFNLTDKDLLRSFYDLLIKKDYKAISKLDEISQNKDLSIFFKDLLFYIKDIIISKIWNEDIKNDIYIFETIENSYQKIKNTFDIKVLFQVCISKIITNYTSQEIWEKTVATKNRTIKNEEKIIQKVEQIEPKKEELTIDDLNDIFWDEKVEKKEELKTIDISMWNFDKIKFINILKDLKAKWAITMSIRWSEVWVQGNELIIKTTTATHLKQLNNSESLSIMSEALGVMWVSLNIKII